MLSALKDHLRQDDDEGFTLIELMVVVLIIAILLAIAIPTYLSARNSANQRAAQSNLNSAVTAEQTYFTNNNQQFGGPSVMNSAEASLTWQTTASTAANQITTTTGDSALDVVLQAQGKDGNCYTVLLSNDPNNGGTGYNISNAACTVVSQASMSGVTFTQGTATGGETSGSDASGSWYTSW